MWKEPTKYAVGTENTSLLSHAQDVIDHFQQIILFPCFVRLVLDLSLIFIETKTFA